uniref:BED-type domain-containing protein n=1 Tax=Strigamia maritima TaxID=126957 RepID=T1IT56_STRMM
MEMENNAIISVVDIEVDANETADKKRSVAWQHFTVLDSGFSKCNYCSKTYNVAGKSKGSTTNMLKHLNSKHKSKICTDRTDKQPTITDALKKKVKRPFSQIRFRQKLIKWIIVTNQAHRIVEEETFLELLAEFSDEAFIPKRDTVKADIMKAYIEMKKKISEILSILSCRLSFTHDCWTSPNGIFFLGITCHWITEKWEYQSVLLDFIQLKGKHTGINIADAFMNTLTDFNITSKILSITTDNASNNDTFVASFTDKHNELTLFDLNSITFTKDHHVRCFAHIMNLSVQSFLSSLLISLPINEDFELEADPEDYVEPNLTNHGTIISKLRNLIKKIRVSPQKLQKLSEACKILSIDDVKPIIDVKTRWNLTFYMIQRAVRLRNAITTISAIDKDLKRLLLEESEWEAMNSVMIILSKFEKATKHEC